MPSSEAELDDSCIGGDENSRGGGDGDDLHDAELLLPGDVPAHEIPKMVQSNFIFIDDSFL